MLMRKRIFEIVVCLLLSTFMIATGETSTGSGETQSVSSESGREQIKQHSLPGVSLGSYESGGASPGYTITRTFKDAQTWYGGSRRVEWRTSPVIHFTWESQFIPGSDPTVSARWLTYNAFDPTDGSGGGFVMPYDQPLNPSPFTYTTGNPSADVDETGHMIIAGHSGIPSEDSFVRTAETFWDTSGAGNYGLFFVGDTIPKSLAIDPAGTQGFPKIEYQEYSGQYITHLLVSESPNYLTYWRRVGGNGTMQGWTTELVTDAARYCEGSIAASRESFGGPGGKVAICWTQAIDPAHVSPGDDWGCNIAFVESSDGGQNWSAPQQIINFDSGEDTQVGWIESCALYDSESYLHIVFASPLYVACMGTADMVDMSRIMHWSNRQGGPNAGGNLLTVAIGDMGELTSMCGRGGWNVLSTAKPMISECSDRLYTVWQQFGDYYSGDTTDCASHPQVSRTGAYNSDIFMSVSLTLDGMLWDAPRNLTNSKSPGCDGTAGNECDHDNYPTMSRHGMNAADFGSTSWGEVSPDVFAVRDQLDAGFPDDGYYLDVFYVDDLFPGNAAWSDNGVWTDNPLKWFRLPCVLPAIYPRLYIEQSDFLLPNDWVKAGRETSFQVTVENIGNDVLDIPSIVPNLDGSTPAGAVSISPTSLMIGAGSSDEVTVTLNPSGFIHPAEGTEIPIIAEVVFNSNDSNRPAASLQINTVVTDTVAPEEWKVITNGEGMSLAVSSNGDAGRYSVGSQNLDFVSAGIDCDSSADVYLASLGTVSVSPDSTAISASASVIGAWLFYDAFAYALAPSLGGTELQPIGDNVGKTWSQCDPKAKRWLAQQIDGLLRWSGKAPRVPMGLGVYQSGIISVPGSGVGIVKHWLAPQTSGSFFIERITAFSIDGQAHPNQALGEIIDWDIPSDIDHANEGGFSSNPGSVDYMWMRGIETDPGAGCTDNDRRYGASGLLGYFWGSEYAADDQVNHTGLFGGHVLLPTSLYDNTNGIIDDNALRTYLNQNSFTADNSQQADQIMLLSLGQFDIPVGDTINIWLAHAAVRNGDQSDVQTAMIDAMDWYLANRSEALDTVCCGRYTGGFTGNIDCDTLGKINLSDITELICIVYGDPIWQYHCIPCCKANCNVDGDPLGKLALSDITKLIDHVYLSKQPTLPCQ